MKCMKCGAENRDDQKVCLRCGALTPAGGGFYFKEKEKWWQSRDLQIKVGAGLAVLLLIFIIVKAMHTDPPEVVARQWFEAMVDRRVIAADEYTTSAYQDDLTNRMMDSRGVSDECYTAVVLDGGKYKVGKPVAEAGPKKVLVSINVMDAEGSGRSWEVHLIKKGRSWRINQVQF